MPAALRLPGPHVAAERRLTHPVQIQGKPVVNLPVLEPRPGLPVDLGRAGLKQEHRTVGIRPGSKAPQIKVDFTIPVIVDASTQMGLEEAAPNMKVPGIS